MKYLAIVRIMLLLFGEFLGIAVRQVDTPKMVMFESQIWIGD